LIRRQGSGARETFTVRKVQLRGVGVERTFPVHSPSIDKIEGASPGARVRRAQAVLPEGAARQGQPRIKERRDPEPVADGGQWTTSKILALLPRLPALGA